MQTTVRQYCFVRGQRYLSWFLARLVQRPSNLRTDLWHLDAAHKAASGWKHDAIRHFCQVLACSFHQDSGACNAPWLLRERSSIWLVEFAGRSVIWTLEVAGSEGPSSSGITQVGRQLHVVMLEDACGIEPILSVVWQGAIRLQRY